MRSSLRSWSTAEQGTSPFLREGERKAPAHLILCGHPPCCVLGAHHLLLSPAIAYVKMARIALPAWRE